MEPTHDLNIPVGAPVWMDLVSSDPAKSAPFYSALLGWQVRDTPPEFGGYQYFELDGRAVGGMMKNTADFDMPDAWSIFLRTDDAAKTEQSAREHGGEVLQPTMKVFDNGSLTIVRDPGGAVISAWQPDNERGFGRMHEANTPYHFELHTNQYDESLAFYRDVFGWTVHELANEPGFRYSGFGPAEMPLAGIMDSSPFPAGMMPTVWSCYLKVNDVDATLARVTELGGTVLHGPDDTPFGVLATVADPTGATIKVQS